MCRLSWFVAFRLCFLACAYKASICFLSNVLITHKLKSLEAHIILWFLFLCVTNCPHRSQPKLHLFFFFCRPFVFQECTRLGLTTWPHLLPILGHPKIGLHHPRTGQQHHHHHLQVCISLAFCLSLSVSLYFPSLYICVTAPVRSDLSVCY